MMSLDMIVKRSKAIESALTKLGASGKGIHEKATSIEGKLTSDLEKKIRFIASVRNKSIHDDDYSISEETMSGYLSVCEEVELELTNMLAKAKSDRSPSVNSSSKGFAEKFDEASPLGKVGIIAGIALAAFALFK